VQEKRKSWLNGTKQQVAGIVTKWSDKRKKAINCDAPKGFSEKAHCAGKKKMAGGGLAKPQQSLKDWGKQDWTTKSGKKSSDTGERYLPKAAIKSLSASEYAATTKAKRAGKAAGKQFVAQPKTIAKKTAGFR
jgi:hypothetical protein